MTAIAEAMKVSVVCLRRAGRVVPRWQVHRAERVVGELTVEEQLDPRCTATRASRGWSIISADPQTGYRR